MFTKTTARTLTKILYIAIISVGLVFIFNQPTFAKSFKDMTPSEQVESVSYYDTLRDCVANNMYGTIKTKIGESGAANPASTPWFDDNNAYGYVFQDGKTVKKDCKAIVSDALQLWGWGSDYRGFLEKMGYKYNSSVPELKRDGNGTERQSGFDSAVQLSENNTVFARNFGGYAFSQLGGSAKFKLYESQLSTCKATNLGLMSQLDATEKSLVNSGSSRDGLTYKKMNMLDSEGRVKEHGYSYSSSVTPPILYGYSNGGSNYGQQKASCTTILTELSKVAQVHAFYLAQEACKANGISKQSEIDACANGYLNTPLAYCTTTYAGKTDDRKACYKGQGNEAAEACILLGYSSSSLLQACINGSKNKTAGYCEAAYVGVFSAGQGVSRDAEKAACIVGQGIAISSAPVVSVDIVANDCTADPSATGCETASSCVIEGIGWIVCPVVNFMAGLADGAFGFLANNFLKTDPQTFNTTGETYKAWSVMRTIANVAFVIVFLIIIFSQLTNVGVSNYGVKKMMPRIIIAAILVNLSYFISQIAIDLSNILGYSIKDVFDNITNMTSGDTAQEALALSPLATSDGFMGIVGSILAGAVVGVALYALLSTLIPVLLAVVVALVMILFILIARQAIIILLVVISPLAFVAYLLPNTESLFTKWRKALTSMLLLFPIIALVFGASTLASGILVQTFTGALGESDSSNFFGQIAAAAVLVLPLFVVPTLLKKSLDGIPAIGQVANRFASRANGNSGRKLGDSYKGSLVARGRAIRKGGTENYRTRKFAEKVTKGGAGALLAGGVAVTAAGKAGQESLLKSAVSTDLRARAEEVEAAKAVIEQANLSGSDRQILAMEGKVTKVIDGKEKTFSGAVMQKAAIQEQFKTGSLGDMHALTEQSHKTGKLAQFSQTIAQGVVSNGIGSKDPALSGKRIDDIAQGGFNYSNAVTEAIKEGKYTADAFATMNDAARGKAINVAREAEKAGDPTLIQSLRQAATGIKASSDISGKISGNQLATAQIDSLLNGAIASATTSARDRANATIATAAQGTQGDTVFVVDRTNETTQQKPGNNPDGTNR